MGGFAVQAWAGPAVTLDNKPLTFDVSPVVENGRTLVPLRVIFESLGAKVNWDGEANTVTAVKGNVTLKLKIGDNLAYKNGSQVRLDVPPKIIKNRTLVPLRFVSEALGAYVHWDSGTQTVTISSNHVSVHFIDVGQADSILIETSNGKNVLIDGGNIEDGTKIVNYIKEQGIVSLDLVVSTHPHEDHIGGLPLVLENFKVSKIIDSGAVYNSDIYKEYMAEIKAKNIPVETPHNQVISLGDGVTAKVLGPDKSNYEDLNDDSVVIRLDVKNENFLFTGDMEKEAEADLLNRMSDVEFLKVAHHGSKTSTTEDFLKVCKPEIAVISVGSGNEYGHPAQDVLNRLNTYGAMVYRTDINGTVEIDTDGSTYNVITQKITAQTPVTPPPATQPPASAPAKVVISSIDLKGEIAVIKNNGSTDINMTGWKLVSQIGNQTYNFPDGFILKAGASVNIRSGPSAFEKLPADLLWTKSYIWNNDGDPGNLYDKNGNLVSGK